MLGNSRDSVWTLRLKRLRQEKGRWSDILWNGILRGELEGVVL